MVTQWEIWDAYVKDLTEQERVKEREKERKSKKKKGKEKEKKPEKKEKDKEGSLIYSSAMQMSLKMVERCVNQIAFDDILQDFKYWDDESDKHKKETGSLLPLWQFSSMRARNKMVTSICWNNEHLDLFAVGYGSYDFTRQGTGVICCFSLKNPSAPEFVYNIESGVMCLDFNAVHAPAMLAVGLYDGSVLVYDLSKKDAKTGGCDKQPIIKSDIKTKKHMDPVWQVRWHAEDLSGSLSFLSISTDGKMMQWTLTTNELQVATIMGFKLLLDDGIDADETQLVGLAGATCFDFNKESPNLFVVGTEEGDIYKCSTAYSTEYLMAYDQDGHDMNVYAVKYNYFHPRAFLSCSADWTVKLWDHSRPAPIMSRDLGNAVSDVAWAPFSSTVFAAVTADAKVHVFDLAQNKYEPMCEQKVIRKAKLTHISFNPIEPIILVGDDRGCVTSLKLSPNLRQVVVVQSHLDEKTGEPKPFPKEQEDIDKWNKEILEAQIDKLQQVMERVSQQNGDKKGDGII